MSDRYERSRTRFAATLDRIATAEQPVDVRRVAVLIGLPLRWWRSRLRWSLSGGLLGRTRAASDFLVQQRACFSTHRDYWRRVGAAMDYATRDIRRTGVKLFEHARLRDLKACVEGPNDALVLVSHQVSKTEFELDCQNVPVQMLQDLLHSRASCKPLVLMYVVCESAGWAAASKARLPGTMFSADYEVSLHVALPLLALCLQELDGTISLAEAQRRAVAKYSTRSAKAGDR